MTDLRRRSLLAALLMAPFAVQLAAFSAEDALLKQAQGVFKPLSAAASADAARVELGRALFHDTRLSADKQLSCASCHNLATFGTDNQATSTGFKNQHGDRNAPTVLNAGLHLAQFWDGRAKDLSEQAKGPILNPKEMALPSAEAAVARLKAVPGYRAAFAKAFPGQKDALSYDNVGKAIAAFEGTLVTPARFDRFLAGDGKALSAQERQGLKLFMDKGCAACHSGVAVGGNSYMKFGMVSPYANTQDLGRYAVTKNPADKYVFKVPSLRNVTQTFPYFHDGKVAKLEDAVRVMGKTQLGVNLTSTETHAITAFLGSLEGTVTPAMKKKPQLP